MTLRLGNVFVYDDTVTPPRAVGIQQANGVVDYFALGNTQPAAPAAATASTPVVSDSGLWTPAFAIVTPGNFSGTLSAQIGNYWRIGSRVFVDFDLTWSAFTHTTASGTASITGLPFAVAAAKEAWGAMQWSGITKASYTNIVCRATASGTTLDLLAMGSGVANASLVIADFPTGGTPRLKGSVSYLTA